MKNRFFSTQEMASSSCHNSIPLATLLEWYKIRDTLFGENFVGQDVSLAVHLAASCNHPDADRLAKWCFGKRVRTREVAIRVFSSLDQNDPCMLCFTWMFGDRRDLTLLRRSAELVSLLRKRCWLEKHKARKSSSLLSSLLLKGSVTAFFSSVHVFVLEKVVKRTWIRRRTIFCVRRSLDVFHRLSSLDVCWTSQIQR